MPNLNLIRTLSLGDIFLMMYPASKASAVPTASEWKEYKQRRKDLARAAELYRRENRELKKRLASIEAFVLHLIGGGYHHEKVSVSSVDGIVSDDHGTNGLCGRGRPKDALW